MRIRSKKKDKKNPLRVLVTAGPTREYIDPVRYISNDSSGKMGFALASAALKFGADVTIVTGPVRLETPNGAKRIDVTSTAEMRSAALASFKRVDIAIMAAAVADFRPARRSHAKIKKECLDSIELVRNPDILKELCKARRAGQTVVGFALESSNVDSNARKKLIAKGCDMIIANEPGNIASDLASATIHFSDGRKIRLPRLHKDELAVLILSHILTS